MNPLRSVVALAFATLACGGGAEGPLVVESGPTKVTLRLDPFAIEVAGVPAAPCAPLAVALREPADTRYHAPEDPRPALVWRKSGKARVVGRDPLVLEVALEGGLTARVTARAGAEGFVDLDVVFSPADDAIALAGACFPFGGHAVGGGERFAGPDLRGKVVPLAFAAPGPFASSTNESHAPVPFLAATTGLGLLVESERPGAFDVGAARSGELRLRFHGKELPLRLRKGTILENVAAHARRMGLPPMPPLWALAPQEWRNELAVSVDAQGVVTSTGQDRILADARKLRELGIPTTLLWIDAPWETGYNTFRFNTVQFPDPPGMIAELERLGFRVITWSTEHVNQSDDSGQMHGMPPQGSLTMFERYAEAGLFVEDTDGQPLVFPWARGRGGLVDFTNPAAVEAHRAEMRPLLDLGVRGFKLDYGEFTRPDLLGLYPNTLMHFADGTTAEVQHTRYPRLYHEAFLGALQTRWPGDHFVITRTGGIFDQKNGVTLWPGDLDNDFSRHGERDAEGKLAVGGLPAAVGGALSLAMSGYPLYGSDIGGYRGGPPTTEVLLRWAQFGAVSTVMQLGGGGTGDATHNPWDARYAPEAVAVYRRHARLHMDLLPTWEALLWRATRTGAPVLVPLGAAAPDDEEAWADAMTFLVGEDLLAAPVVEAARTRRLRFPAGTWLHWWSGAEHAGPATKEVAAPLEELPLFVRAGAVVVLGDPRLMTAVAAGAGSGVADAAAFGGNAMVRTTAGEPGRFALRDGTEATQETAGAQSTVRVASPAARRVFVDFRVRAGAGPGDAAQVEVRVDGAPATPVATADEAELWDCAAACVWRQPGRLLATARGASVEVRLSGGR